MKRTLIAFSLLLSGLLNSHSQIKPQDIKSPEAAAYERMTEVPVGAYTGSLNLSIPIYTIKCGDLSLPISLDYMGSAIRVDQEATWVGLNWMLNAGGAVTTKVIPSNANWSNLSGDWNKLQSFSNVTPAVGEDNFLTYYRPLISIMLYLKDTSVTRRHSRPPSSTSRFNLYMTGMRTHFS